MILSSLSEISNFAGTSLRVNESLYPQSNIATEIIMTQISKHKIGVEQYLALCMNDSQSTRKKAITTNMIFAVVIALLSSIGFYYFPLVGDDLNSVHAIKESFLTGSPVDWTAYADNIKYIFYNNHFRLPNLIMPAMALLPKWIPALLSGLALLAVMWQGARIGGFTNSPVLFAFYATGIVLAFPWIDQMYLISFQMPYLWGAVFSLLLIRGIFTHRKLPMALLFLFSTIVSFWMEAYGGAILGACICLIVFYKRFRTKSIYTISAGLVMGIICVGYPMIIGSTATYHSFFQNRIMMVLPYLIPTVIYLLLDIAFVFRKRDIVIEPLNLTLTEIAVASLILTMFFKTGSRVDGLGVVCALIGIFHLIGKTAIKCGGKIRSLLVLTLLVANSIHLIAVDRMCYRLGTETKLAVNEFLAGKPQPVFAPISLRENAPWYLLQKPYYDWFAHRKTLAIFNKIYGDENHKMTVVPIQLKDFSFDKCNPVPGTAGIYEYRGHLVATEWLGYLMADYGSGAKAREFHCVQFKNVNDTTPLCWLHPDQAGIDIVLHPNALRIDKLEEE